MKTSHVIKELNKLIEAYGDRDLNVFNYTKEITSPVQNIFYDMTIKDICIEIHT